MTPEQIVALPASWYSSQPIPVRLAAVIAADRIPLRCGVDRDVRRLYRLVFPYRPLRLSLVERIHRRHVAGLVA